VASRAPCALFVAHVPPRAARRTHLDHETRLAMGSTEATDAERISPLRSRASRHSEGSDGAR
jgi:hypothetical protein